VAKRLERDERKLMLRAGSDGMQKHGVQIARGAGQSSRIWPQNALHLPGGHLGRRRTASLSTSPALTITVWPSPPTRPAVTARPANKITLRHKADERPDASARAPHEDGERTHAQFDFCFLAAPRSRRSILCMMALAIKRA
jgi:hypothetical protein